MGKKFTRWEILKRLRKTIADNKPIIAAGCSAGIIAKSAEMGGADLIMVYSTGLSRLKGLPTTLIDNSNEVTLNMLPEIRKVVKDTPIIAGIEASSTSGDQDPSELINQFIDAGFSGIINFPTIGLIRDKQWRKKKGFQKEIEMIQRACDRKVFSMAYVFWPMDARSMAFAGVDCLVPHVGGTAGGTVGYDALTHREAAERIQKMIGSAKKVNPKIFCLGHGGPFATPDDTIYLYQHTDAAGFVGASSIERIPVEKAVKLTVLEFKNIPVKK
ncbi:MAG: phosphoenolpyruvate hydrolase family protein [Candidatus Helarchaeota archaeon]|nr:phosphoenolpyruvate hydrolase family protein [Candidatus Helarchaeota archaeon]